MVVSFLLHCMTRKSHSGGEELGWRQNLWFRHSPVQLNAPQPHSSKMRAEQHLGGVCSVSDAWCSKAQHKHQQWQSGACMRSEQAQTHTEMCWQSRSRSFLSKLACIWHLDCSRSLSCFLCFLYLSNHSRHAQTPTTCCQRHLMLRSGGVRSSISGWENIVLLMLQRQGGQEKKH